ncbi:fimbrial protein [Rahnella sp. L72c]|uniref:Fimbrial protein n=1 Tax=Rahnella perminowiae TaxID=2816244 RepID=A0ABS6KW57_9GAMM|nr:fimbrial protein [Rahnella perminowiae]MBU9833563.1 fimbrial protein [Rahnella perminowiae]
MKKILFCSILSLALIQTTQAADGVINFTGNITGSACVVDTSSVAQSVNLGTVSRNAFSGGSGATAAAKRFNIVLRSCPESISSATVRFDGNTNAVNSSILALDSTQTATNVGVALYEQDGLTLIPVGNDSASVALQEDVDNTLTYFAKYMATGAVGAGTANSSTAFSVIYQ